jgi:uncharacterized membrane protein
MAMDLAMLTFDHPEGAERALAKVRDAAAGAAWLDEFALVERRHNGRIVIRGTFAGHYLDVDQSGDPMGRDTAIGALTGAVIGAAFGWFGFAAGLLAGGAVGGLVQAERLPELHGELFEEIRADVREHGSAIILLAAPGHVDAMADAFEGSNGHLIRRELSDATLTSLEAVVAQAPIAAGAPQGEQA